MKSTIKNIVKALLPNKMLKTINKRISNYQLWESYAFDKKRLKKYAYNLRSGYTEDNLRSKITFHYHSIEKGLSNANLRLGFGKSAFEELFFAMDKYIEMDFPTSDNRFQSAISVIQAYVELHRERNFIIDNIEEKLVGYNKYFINKDSNKGGYLTFSRKDLPDFERLSFEELANSRYSVRDFGNKEVRDEEVYDSIQIATKTPSVCNRQAWRVYYIKNESKVKNVLNLQGGLTGNGNNLKKLLLVTCDKQYMNGPHERNQTYIDGGLFTMSLLYALESKGLATCTLNTDFSIVKEKDMRNLLDISLSEDLIAFIAVGNYPNEIKVAKSPRDNVRTIVKNID